MTVKKTTSDALKLKQLMHREAPALIREKLAEYLHCLKEGRISELLLCVVRN